MTKRTKATAAVDIEPRTLVGVDAHGRAWPVPHVPPLLGDEIMADSDHRATAAHRDHRAAVAACLRAALAALDPRADDKLNALDDAALAACCEALAVYCDALDAAERAAKDTP